LETAKRYAIDIKEKSKAIQNVVASLSDNYDNLSDAFQKKVAVSSDEEYVSAEYVGNGTENSNTSQFDIQINRLASPQINTGNYLKNQLHSFIPGAYAFDLSTATGSYELQYNVNADETNLDVVNKLARLINTSDLGINAEVLSNDDSESALSLTSRQTGLAPGEPYLFSIQPESSAGSINAMNLLGINHITSEAQNSDFLLNGKQQNSLSNTFTINNAFELTLKQAHPEGESATIGFKTNTDAVADNIQTLVDAFNDILSVAEKYSQTGAGHGMRLLSDMSAVSRSRMEQLNSIGLMVADNGSITIDRDTLAEAIVPERTESTFQTLADFRDAIGAKADSASVNPMHYVDKIIVAYKNPGHNFVAPYVSSIYSGMMLDSFV
jgi:flagellar hook-associated protein 2